MKGVSTAFLTCLSHSRALPFTKFLTKALLGGWHYPCGARWLWKHVSLTHRNSSSPRDATFFTDADEDFALMYPCYFHLEPASPLEHLSLILSTDLGM